MLLEMTLKAVHARAWSLGSQFGQLSLAPNLEHCPQTVKTIRYIAAIFALVAAAAAAPLKDSIKIEAMIVTKAELRRHMSAPEEDRLRPATYADLEASRGSAQPDYLVVRFLEIRPGHFWGEAEARIDSSRGGTKLNVVLHFNRGWVEYFIPLDGGIYSTPNKEGGPVVSVTWNSLQAE